MVWTVLTLMLWMSMIEFQSHVRRVFDEDFFVRLWLFFLEKSWWRGTNFDIFCRNWGGGEGCEEVLVVRYPSIGHVNSWFRHQVSISHYYCDRFWFHGVDYIPDLEGGTRRGVEQHMWQGAVPDISEWDWAGQSGTEQRQASHSCKEQDGSGQVSRSTIIYERSMDRKNGTNNGRAATGITDGVVCNDRGIVQR